MLEKYLHTHDQQFGFKSQHATDMCIFTVKSVIKYFTKQNSTVYTCFLNAAKAFERVSHWTLFTGFILLQAYKKLSLFMAILAKTNYDFFMTSAIFLCRGLMFSNDVTH